MKSNLIKIVLIVLDLALSSCVQPHSPAIYFDNVSNEYIRNITGDWNGYYLHGDTLLHSGQSSSKVFSVESKSHIFGPVHLEWENAKGEKFRKDFVFKKEELPTYAKTFGAPKNYYNYIRFYFDQDGVEYYTSDNPDIEKIEKEMQRVSEKSRSEFRKKYPCWNLNPPSETRMKTGMRGNYLGVKEPNPWYDEEMARYNKKCKK
jgi:hypothetical protein